jgi:hypothetical protein
MSLLSLHERFQERFHDDAKFLDTEEQWFATYPLLEYAAWYWGEHVRPVETDVFEMTTAFLEHSKILGNISAVTQSGWHSEQGVPVTWREWSELPRMKAIASQGLSWRLRSLLADGLDLAGRPQQLVLI